jgi:hypothetical protein
MTVNMNLQAARHESAIQLALGYAWGREDAGGTVTAGPASGTPQIPSSAFADAFAQGQDEYDTERRGMMTNVRSAYERWQATNGQTIWDSWARPAKPLPAWVASQLATRADGSQS